MDLSIYITKDGDHFYLDINNDTIKESGIEYEDGDKIKWSWEEIRYSGVLRQIGFSRDLFVLANVTKL